MDQPSTIAWILDLRWNSSRLPLRAISTSCDRVIRQSRTMISLMRQLGSWLPCTQLNMSRISSLSSSTSIRYISLLQKPGRLRPYSPPSFLVYLSRYSSQSFSSFLQSANWPYYSTFQGLTSLSYLVYLSLQNSSQVSFSCRSGSISQERPASMLEISLYRNRQKWTWLSSCLEIMRFWIADMYYFQAFICRAVLGAGPQEPVLWRFSGLRKLVFLSRALVVFFMDSPRLVWSNNQFLVAFLIDLNSLGFSQLPFCSAQSSCSWLMSKCQNISQGSILLLMSVQRARLRNELEVFPRAVGIIFLIVMVFILVFSQAQVRPVQGVEPVSISQKITPMAQMSLLWLYLLLFRAYGGMQTGEPTLYFSVFLRFYCLTAKPKSPISSCELWKKMLAGFRSLCTMPSEYRPSQPFMICFIILVASYSLSFFLALISLPRSPPSQKSVIMYVLFLSQHILWTSSKLGLFLIRDRISISPASRFLWISPFMVFMSITLMATCYSESINRYLSGRPGPGRRCWRNPCRWTPCPRRSSGRFSI